MCLFSRSLLGLRRELFPLEIFIESAEREAAIEPDLPIVDPHHHLFDARCDDKGWPVSDLTIKVLYALKPSIAAKVIGGSQDERVIRTFSNLMPAIVPYMENGMLRDISNARHQGDWPMTEDDDDEKDDGKLPAHNVIATVYIESGWDDPNAKAFSCTLGGFDGAVDIHLIFNMHWETLDFEIPQIEGGRNWYKVVDTAEPSPTDILDPCQEVMISGNSFLVKDRSVVVLISA